MKITVKTLAILTASLLLSTQSQGANRTFDKVCKSCHTGGLKGFISGAPNINKPTSWIKYLERDSVEQMQQIVIHGNADHKAKGDCDHCSDQQVIDAIDYMLLRVQ